MKICFLSLIFGSFYLVIQTALLSFFFPSYLIPDLILIIVFFLGTQLPSWEKALVPFVLGYLADTFAGGIIGITSFSLTSIFLILYLLSKRMDFNIVPLRVIGVIIAGVIKGLILIFFLRFTEPQREVIHQFLWILLPNVMVTGAVSPFFLHILDRFKDPSSAH